MQNNFNTGGASGGAYPGNTPYGLKGSNSSNSSNSSNTSIPQVSFAPMPAPSMQVPNRAAIEPFLPIQSVNRIAFAAPSSTSPQYLLSVDGIDALMRRSSSELRDMAKTHQSSQFGLASLCLALAARQDSDAQYGYGRMLETGTGRAPQPDQAVLWYRRAAEQGHAEAQRDLARCLANGLGVAKDIHEAVAWYDKAAAQGVQAATDEKQALMLKEVYLPLAHAGDAEAQYECALHYMRPSSKDITAAMAWFDKAARQGHAVAQFHHARLCFPRKGGTVDPKLAFEGALKAATAGQADGMLMLALCYSEAVGTEQDHIAAFRWAEQAAQRGSSSGQFLLSRFYRIGQGIEVDHSKALAWELEAARQNHPAAQYYVGIQYLDGTGVEKDEKEAIGWLQKSADQKYPSAIAALAQCYFLGRGVEKNLALAEQWRQRVESTGDQKAIASLTNVFASPAPQ